MFSADVGYEYDRLEVAKRVIPDIVERFTGLNEEFAVDLAGRRDTRAVVIKHATALWESASLEARATRFDDRSLYWGRLLLEKTLIEAKQKQFVPLFEEISRNCQRAVHRAPNTIALTGFDPFNLTDDIAQSNPSGTYALALDETPIHQWLVKSVIFPVRYADFDNQCVEDALTPVLTDPSTRLVLTVSMGREAFDLERFPANCRGNERPDNQGVAMTDSSPPQDLSHRPGFVEFTLPATSIRCALPSAIRDRVNDNRNVATVEDGQLSARDLTQLKDKTPTAGSGGNFLSNEISYRALALQAKLGTNLPVGHIHVPRMKGYDQTQLEANFREFVAILTTLVKLVQDERQEDALR